ncbi:DUF6233 domain-containing protein [Streptomyces sp. NBC_00249]|uniref:DUF6233 domain-containing protein n=1 Tax=Streptomyces sp. NBC_00249 TaxID=2975690 RepID=UPI0022554A20|nr:DUF6233 domain-containing protein [Streptomyces sp. NBC_00249]MCX5199719.1 DUF6233 domain-containing protein [Streptomyces sp. NBC_00249]
MNEPASPPPVWLTLPDGQTVRARLHARRWTPSGWRYRVGLPVWSVTPERDVEPVEYTVWVPADEDDDYVRPVEGADYSTVPVEERPPPRPSHPYLAPPPPGVDMSWAWTVEHTRAAGPGSPATGTVVHEYGCALAPPGSPELDLDEALTALARPRARACQQCAAAEVLTRL